MKLTNVSFSNSYLINSLKIISSQGLNSLFNFLIFFNIVKKIPEVNLSFFSGILFFIFIFMSIQQEILVEKNIYLSSRTYKNKVIICIGNLYHLIFILLTNIIFLLIYNFSHMQEIINYYYVLILVNSLIINEYIHKKLVIDGKYFLIYFINFSKIFLFIVLYNKLDPLNINYSFIIYGIAFNFSLIFFLYSTLNDFYKTKLKIFNIKLIKYYNHFLAQQINQSFFKVLNYDIFIVIVLIYIFDNLFTGAYRAFYNLLMPLILLINLHPFLLKNYYKKNFLKLDRPKITQINVVIVKYILIFFIALVVLINLFDFNKLIIVFSNNYLINYEYILTFWFFYIPMSLLNLFNFYIFKLSNNFKLLISIYKKQFFINIILILLLIIFNNFKVFLILMILRELIVFIQTMQIFKNENNYSS